MKSQTQTYQEFCMALWFNCDFFLAEQVVVEWYWRRWGRQADPAVCEAGLRE